MVTKLVARRGQMPALAANAWLRYDVVRPLIGQLPPGKVVEFGPGLGGVGARIAAMGHEYVGVEPSDATRAITARRLTAVSPTATVVGSLGELGQADDADLLCAFEVLEHVEDDVATLEEWLGCLRPGGRVLLSMPAFPERFGPFDEEAGHLRRYSVEDAESLVRRAGLVDPKVVVYGFPAGVALEGIRNRLAIRERHRTGWDNESAANLTAASARWRQPPPWAGPFFEIATLPARLVQRAFLGRGTGLVVDARKPER